MRNTVTPLLLTTAFFVLAGSAVQAQTVELFSLPSGPNPATVNYPVGATDPSNTDPIYKNIPFLYGPFTVAAGINDVTFTATQTAQAGQNGKSFETFVNDGGLDFPIGTNLIDTGVGSNRSDGNTPTGPLRIDFSQGVSAFGLNAQDAAVDMETFTFTVFTDGNTTTGTTFVTPAYDNTVNPAGKSVFLGAQSLGGSLITSVLISSESVATDPITGVSTANSNDIYFGPLSTNSPVPEASTTVSFGLLLALGLSGVLLSSRKKPASRINR